MTDEDMKKCAVCGEVKPTSEFYPRKESKSGYRRECKTCSKQIHKKYREDNPGVVRKRRKDYNKKHPDVISAQQTRYRKTHRKEENARAKKWRQNNPERFEEIQHKYRVCKILKNHAADLRDDPERLSTEFLQTLIGYKCEETE